MNRTRLLTILIIVCTVFLPHWANGTEKLKVHIPGLSVIHPPGLSGSTVEVSSALPQRYDGYDRIIVINPFPEIDLTWAFAKADAIHLPGGNDTIWFAGLDDKLVMYGFSELGEIISLKTSDFFKVDTKDIPDRSTFLLNQAESTDYRPGILLLVHTSMNASGLEQIENECRSMYAPAQIDIAVHDADGVGVLPARVGEMYKNVRFGAHFIHGQGMAPTQTTVGFYLRMIADIDPPEDWNKHDLDKRIADIKTRYADREDGENLRSTEIANEIKMHEAKPRGFHNEGLSYWQNHQAWFYVEHKIVDRYDRAMQLSLGALIHEPTEPDYLDTLAEIFYSRGAHRKALEVIDEALKQPMDHEKPIGKSKLKYLREQREKFQKALDQQVAENSEEE